MTDLTKMTITRTIDVATIDPNVLGELLREAVFTGSDDDFGCYTTFEVVTEAQPLDVQTAWAILGEHIPEQDPHLADAVQGYSVQMSDFQVEFAWYWDGDGTLDFRISRNGTVLRHIENTDCKKSYGWRDSQ